MRLPGEAQETVKLTRIGDLLATEMPDAGRQSNEGTQHGGGRELY
jgi:hypothetical protein